MNALMQALEVVREIDRITKENPVVLPLLEMAYNNNGLVLPIRPEYIPANMAAKLITVSRNSIYEYARQGLIGNYTLPGKTQGRFKTSEILSLPKRKEK